jgi:2,4-dienoyl-CoA reductase-like NADH-dependent reductase (Old Yellow Enzyme family)
LVGTEGAYWTRIPGTRFFNSRGSDDLYSRSQVPFAAAVKKAHPDIAVGAVGLITTATQANSVLVEGKADIVLLAREFLRDPYFVLRAADELGVVVRPAVQYERAWQTGLARGCSRAPKN